MINILSTLREYDALRDKVAENPDEVKSEIIESIQPDYDETNILSMVDPSIKKILEKENITELYKHQAQAILKSIEGNNVILESPTASGKTLSFIIPLLDHLIKNPKSHAMLIYPMKAIANDQRRQITNILGYYKFIESWTYDGDTAIYNRSAIKNNPPQILITNPENLHLSFLGWSEQWSKFLNNLCFIVVDEIHEYRGFFGTNFSLLLKRFLLKLSLYNCNPRLFLCSATCANPLEHAEQLTGKKFTLISAKNKLRPLRKFYFINPKNIPDFKFIEIFTYRIARAAIACLSHNFSTIIFCPTRKFAEDASRIAKKEADKILLNSDTIAPYKSGLSLEKRREIEKGLRTGEYKVVFSTNALELGIDIGKLDVCILAGFPDSVMSAWQRIGRVGRSWNSEANIIFYAMNNAVDQFYAQNIKSFLDKPLDEIVIGTENEELITRQIPYLLHEIDWNVNATYKSIIGEKFFNIAQKVISERSRVITGKPNYIRLDIRGETGGTNKLIYKDNEIGTISDHQKFKEAYIGAVYYHFGKSYRVLSHGAGEVSLEDIEPYYITVPYFYSAVTKNEIIKGKRYQGKISFYYGKITIFENFTGYKMIDERNNQVIDDVKSTNSIRKEAYTFWIGFEDPDDIRNLSEGLIALENIIRVGAPFVIPSDRHDTSTYSNKNSLEIFLYENFSGGIGISEKAYVVFREIIIEGKKIAENCKCKKGCPRCILPDRYKPNEQLDKREGILLSEYLLEKTTNSPEEIYDERTHSWKY